MLFFSNQEEKELVRKKIYAPDQLGVESEWFRKYYLIQQLERG